MAPVLLGTIRRWGDPAILPECDRSQPPARPGGRRRWETLRVSESSRPPGWFVAIGGKPLPGDRPEPVATPLRRLRCRWWPGASWPLACGSSLFPGVFPEMATEWTVAWRSPRRGHPRHRRQFARGLRTAGAAPGPGCRASDRRRNRGRRCLLPGGEKDWGSTAAARIFRARTVGAANGLGRSTWRTPSDGQPAWHTNRDPVPRPAHFRDLWPIGRAGS